MRKIIIVALFMLSAGLVQSQTEYDESVRIQAAMTINETYREKEYPLVAYTDNQYHQDLYIVGVTTKMDIAREDFIKFYGWEYWSIMYDQANFKSVYIDGERYSRKDMIKIVTQ